MVIQREVAHRVFAAEYNASRVVIKGEGEKAPSFVVTPLGAKINRLLIVGVLTEVERVGEGGNLIRARVSDPTGVFTVYAGQFQPEAMASLANLKPPSYVAIVGKSRVYEPEPGQVYASVRPEVVATVDDGVRDHWLFETAKRTHERIVAMRGASGLESPKPEDLVRLGIAPHLAEGILLALERYEGDVDLDFFSRKVEEALLMLQSGEAIPTTALPAPTVAAKPKVKGPGEETENAILAIIEGLASTTDKGAQWDTIVSEGAKKKLDEGIVEEAINALMDKGLIYEPILGRLKVT